MMIMQVITTRGSVSAPNVTTIIGAIATIGVDWMMTMSGETVRDSSPAALRRDLESSLRALGTDYVDIYQIHWPVEDITELEDAIAFARLGVEADVIAQAGTSATLHTEAQAALFGRDAFFGHRGTDLRDRLFGDRDALGGDALAKFK